MTHRPCASVVIPAHDEERAIGACLTALARSPLAVIAEIIVVANGCSDETAEVARNFGLELPGLVVIELDVASKNAALNAGDQAAVAFPRIFLDADVVLDSAAFDDLVATLTTPSAKVASPRIRFDSRTAGWPVRRFYDAYERTPYVRDGLVGLGVYGLSEAGRRRFAQFPDVIADDLFVQRLFSPEERVTCAGTFTIKTPRTTRALIKVRTRTAQGSAQLDESGLEVRATTARTTGQTARALLDDLRNRPRSAASVVVYGLITAVARINARRVPDSGWLRDDSSRAELPAPSRTSARAQSLSVAYLVSQYPAPSHVFIEREVEALRRRGVDVTTFTVHAAPSESLLGAAMREEASRTVALLGSRPLVVGAIARFALRHPWALAHTLADSQLWGARHTRERLWQLFYVAEACRLLVEMERRSLRHVHAHFANNGADIARATVRLATNSGRTDWTWSFTMHGPTEFEAVEHFGLAEKTRDAAGVACISDFARSQLMRLVAPTSWTKLRVVPMSVDTDAFAPVDRPALEGRPLRVLFVGRLVPEKGPSVLLDALELLRRQGLALDARIAGGGPLAGELATEVAHRGLDDCVALLGTIGQEEIRDLYHWADVFCLPSFQEGLPVVLMEAMATGLPVVTTSIAGIPELVKDGTTGFVVQPGRADLIAEALRTASLDSDQLSDIGRRARAAVIERHSLELAGERQEDFLRQVTPPG